MASQSTDRTIQALPPYAIAAALGLLVVVCYLPAMLWGDLIWDDRIWSRAPAVLKWSGLGTIWFSPSLIEGEAHYWPLAYTTFWLEHKIWGLAPAGYHIVNVALHLANTLLLWKILKRLAVPGAAVVAAVFAAHPLHVESVAWIIERKDVLSALFYLTAVLVWLRFLEQPRLWRHGLALLLFVAGLLSKSIVVTLPAALLILQWWKDGRITGRGLQRLALFFLLALVITAGDLFFYESTQGPGSSDYSLPDRVLIASRALWFYAGKLIWPTHLAVVYPLWEIRVGDPWAWLYLAAAVALPVTLWLIRRRIGRGPLAGALFFAVTLSPTLGFVDFSYMQFSFVADRFQYLAGIGLIAVVVGVASASAATLAKRRSGVNLSLVAAPPLGILLLILGTQTWRQASLYQDEITFNRHIIAFNPQARDAHRNLAAELFKLGRTEEALEAVRIAVKQYPDTSESHAGLAAALIRLERLDEAETPLRRALALNPHDESALRNASELFRLLGRYEEGLAAAETWLQLRPNSSAAHQAIAGLFAGLGRQDETEKHLRRAHALDPQDVVVIQNLAESIRKQGRYEEALEWYDAVLEIKPDEALAYAAIGRTLFELARYDAAIDALTRAHALAPDLLSTPLLLVMMAEAVAKLGRSAEAAEYYARVAEVAPDFVHALFKQASEHAQQERYDKALELFEIVVAIDSDNPAAHSNLGVVLYHLGRTDEAIASFERALSIDPDFEDARNNLRALEQLAR